jgi:hypothetical protein
MFAYAGAETQKLMGKIYATQILVTRLHPLLAGQRLFEPPGLCHCQQCAVGPVT